MVHRNDDYAVSIVHYYISDLGWCLFSHEKSRSCFWPADNRSQYHVWWRLSSLDILVGQTKYVADSASTFDTVVDYRIDDRWLERCSVKPIFSRHNLGSQLSIKKSQRKFLL